MLLPPHAEAADYQRVDFSRNYHSFSDCDEKHKPDP